MAKCKQPCIAFEIKQRRHHLRLCRRSGHVFASFCCFILSLFQYLLFLAILFFVSSKKEKLRSKVGHGESVLLVNLDSKRAPPIYFPLLCLLIPGQLKLWRRLPSYLDERWNLFLDSLERIRVRRFHHDGLLSIRLYHPKVLCGRHFSTGYSNTLASYQWMHWPSDWNVLWLRHHRNCMLLSSCWSFNYFP